MPYTPEDFVASTTEVYSGHGVGLTLLSDGRSLREAVEANPIGYLGANHVARYGANTKLLVKILNTEERLFSHFHPDAAFASQHLDHTLGKTEAWIVVDTDGRDDAYAYLGFNRQITEAEAADWITNQRVPELLEAMNRVPLQVGDTLFVPAGIAHAIGPNITLVELQEPTDLSILIEFEGFANFTLESALLGLDVATAVQGLDRSFLSPELLSQLTAGRPAHTPGATQLFPEAADEFFTAWSLTVETSLSLAAGYSVLVVSEGTGRLEFATGHLELTPGCTVLIPHGAGAVTIVGRLRGIRCAPPAA